jgi:hypothetical protein
MLYCIPCCLPHSRIKNKQPSTSGDFYIDGTTTSSTTHTPEGAVSSNISSINQQQFNSISSTGAYPDPQASLIQVSKLYALKCMQYSTHSSHTCCCKQLRSKL